MKQLDPGSWAFEEQISGEILGSNTWQSWRNFLFMEGLTNQRLVPASL
jgi:hypothetical protein